MVQLGLKQFPLNRKGRLRDKRKLRNIFTKCLHITEQPPPDAVQYNIQYIHVGQNIVGEWSQTDFAALFYPSEIERVEGVSHRERTVCQYYANATPCYSKNPTAAKTFYFVLDRAGEGQNLWQDLQPSVLCCSLSLPILVNASSQEQEVLCTCITGTVSGRNNLLNEATPRQK